MLVHLFAQTLAGMFPVREAERASLFRYTNIKAHIIIYSEKICSWITIVRCNDQKVLIELFDSVINKKVFIVKAVFLC